MRVDLSYVVAEQPIDVRHAALPARPLFRCTLKHLAEEGETLLGQRFRQHGSILFDQVVREPVLPGVQRRRGHQSRLARKGRGLPHDEAGLLAQPRALEIRSPVQARRFGGEVCLRPSVVGLMDVIVVGQAEMLFRNGMFQLHDALGTSVSIRESRELEHGRDVRLILGADVTHTLAVGKVIFAVGQLHPALQQVSGVMVGIVEARSHPQSEQMWCVEVGVV